MVNMKFKILSILAAAALIATIAGISFSTTGCKTITSIIGTNTVQIQAEVTTGATLATTAALQKDPNTRVYFVASVTVLNQFVNTTNTSPAAIAAALAALPVQQLQTPEAQLAIASILGVYDLTYASYVQDAVNENEMANAVLTGLVQGISAGLIAVPAPVAPTATVTSLTKLSSPYVTIKPGLVPKKK